MGKDSKPKPETLDPQPVQMDPEPGEVAPAPRKISLQEYAAGAGLDALAKAVLISQSRPTERLTPEEWLIRYERIMNSPVAEVSSDSRSRVL